MRILEQYINLKMYISERNDVTTNKNLKSWDLQNFNWKAATDEIDEIIRKDCNIT